MLDAQLVTKMVGRPGGLSDVIAQQLERQTQALLIMGRGGPDPSEAAAQAMEQQTALMEAQAALAPEPAAGPPTKPKADLKVVKAADATDDQVTKRGVDELVASLAQVLARRNG